MKKSCSLYKSEQSSTDLQQYLQMSSNSLCHYLAFKETKVCINTDLSVSCNKNENIRWTVMQNEKTLALYMKLNILQRIFNRVSRCHQLVCVML